MPDSRSISGARRWTLGVLLTLLLALCAALLPAHPAHAVPAARTAGGATLHALVNEARAANGQTALLRNGALDAVAEAWALQLAVLGELTHNPDIASQLPGGWVAVGENVAQGYATEAAMHDGWMASSGHRANILGDFTDVGVAFLSAGDTTWGVEVFAAYPGHAAPVEQEAPQEQPAPEAAAPVQAAPTAPKGRTAAAPAEEKATPTPDPTPTASSVATRPTTVYRSQSRPPAQAAEVAADRGDEAFASWLWIGIPSVSGLAALAGGVFVLRTRGLIGRSNGRHTAG